MVWILRMPHYKIVLKYECSQYTQKKNSLSFFHSRSSLWAKAIFFFSYNLISSNTIALLQVYSSEGRFTFTSHTPGEHVICLYSNSTKWFSGSQLVCYKKALIFSYQFRFFPYWKCEMDKCLDFWWYWWTLAIVSL